MLPVGLSQLVPSTSVCIPILAQELEYYPNQQFPTDLVHNLKSGCHIGCQGPRFHRITLNLKPTLLNPEAVIEALHKEISRGHTAGPFSSLRTVPKKGWCIIMDLSSPCGSYIKDYL